jgi:hypothetical protein
MSNRRVLCFDQELLKVCGVDDDRFESLSEQSPSGRKALVHHSKVWLAHGRNGSPTCPKTKPLPCRLHPSRTDMEADIPTRRNVPILLQKSLTRRLPGFEARLLFHCLTSGGARKAHQLVAGRARHAPLAGGGRAISFTSLRRFCAIAASMNSN